MSSNITIDALGLNSGTWIRANDAEVFQYPKTIVGPDDCNFLFRPVIGGLNYKCFNYVLKMLIDNVFPRKMFKTDPTYSEILRGFTDKVYPVSDGDYLKSHMASCKKAVIGKGSKVSVDLSKRDCRRITFGPDIVNQIWDLLKSNMCHAVKNQSCIKVEDVRIDPTHGDILFYEEGGKFDIHRDGQSEFPYGENPLDEFGNPMWIMCSVLIGLHSNLTSENILRGDGNTMVYLPDVNYARLHGSLLEEHSFDSRWMEAHKFVDSVVPGSYVIVPSSAKHSSLPIMQKRGFKLTLKIDVWVKQDLNYKYPLSKPVVFDTMTIDDPYRLYQHLSMNKPNCKCNLCCPYQFARKALKDILLQTDLVKKLPEDILWYASGFLFPDENQVSRNLPCHERYPLHCTRYMNCTCEECIRKTYDIPDWDDHDVWGDHDEWDDHDDWDDHDEWDDHYNHHSDSEESFCNGYEYDDWD